MFDFTDLPFYDNHTHNMDMAKTDYTTRELTINYLHGFRDVLPAKEDAPSKGFLPFGNIDFDVHGFIARSKASDDLACTTANLGINKVMVNYLSVKFGCPPTLEAVNEARNQELARLGPLNYAHSLYKDQNITGCTVDLDWPIGDPRLEQFPGSVQRLFRMDPLFDRLLLSCETYASLKAEYEKELRAAFREGFVGVKCHVGERFTFAIKLISDETAEAVFPSAVNGDPEALADVYFAVVADTMRICRHEDIPIHIHTGSTGGPEDLHNCDPRLMTPFLSNREFLNTKVVFLHANHPNIGEAALMAHTFPHVWLDISWSLPWIALDFPRIMKSALGLAPHNKIMLGTGQHGIPEMVWVASKVAKRSLEIIMGEYVREGFLSREQAFETAEQVLYKNAYRMYGLK